MTTLREQVEAGHVHITIGKQGKVIAFEVWECEVCNGTGLIGDNECEDCGGTGEGSRKITEQDPRWPEIEQIASEMSHSNEEDEEEEIDVEI